MTKDILSKFKNVKERGNGEFIACCPSHNDTTPSLSIKFKSDGKVLMKCHAGCSYDDIMESVGIENKTSKKNDPKKLVKVYDYCDQHGKVLYQSLRYRHKSGRKTFTQRRVGSKGSYVYNMKGVTKVPYRLPELVDGDDPVLIVEGEKDVDNLIDLGFTSTCNIGGAGKWTKDLNKYIENRSAIIIPDCDKAGIDHLYKTGSLLKNVCSSVKWLQLYDEIKETKGKDISDWIEESEHPESLISLLATAKDLESKVEAPKPNNNDLNDILNENQLFILECLQDDERGDAELCAYLFKDKFLYDHTNKLWMHYEDGIWVRDSLFRTKREFITVLKDEYNKVSEILKNDVDNPNTETKSMYINLIRQRVSKLNTKRRSDSIGSLVTEYLGCDFNDFDTNIMFLGMKNGVFCFESLKLLDHSPKNMITKKVSFDYDSDARCFEWDHFMSVIFDNNIELIDYMYKLMSISLTGLVDKEIFIFLYGGGSNGKSTFLNTLSKLSGDYYKLFPSDMLMRKSNNSSDEYYRAVFKDLRVAVADEIGEGVTLNSGLIKNLTGGDSGMSARQPSGRVFHFNPTHTLWMFGNNEPKITGVDKGIWRRVKKIPFIVDLDLVLGNKVKTKSEVEKMFNKELAGIFNRCVQGFKNYKDNGLIDPDIVVKATEQYRNESDILSDWMTEYTIKDVNSTAFSKELWKSWESFRINNGDKKIFQTSSSFYKALRSRGFKSFKGTGNNLTFKGIGLVTDNYEEQTEREEYF